MKLLVVLWADVGGVGDVGAVVGVGVVGVGVGDVGVVGDVVAAAVVVAVAVVCCLFSASHLPWPQGVVVCTSRNVIKLTC